MNRGQFVTQLKSHRFLVSIIGICTIYAIFSVSIMPSWALSADEFVFGRHIFDYTHLVPYRDFEPYKTILGYYLLSIPYYFSHDILNPLYYIKAEIILLNALAIGMVAFLSNGLFNRRAIIFAILAMIANNAFIIYAADLRVDMLTSWFCLFSLLTLLRKKPIVSGLLLAVAFLISQKALWYMVAIDGGLLACYYLFKGSYFNSKQITIFNIALAIPILIYILTWSCLSSVAIVLNNLFYEAYVQSGIVWYSDLYATCWSIILAQGPALFVLWPLTLTSLMGNSKYTPIIQQRVLTIIIASIALVLFINYKQAFPYNFVFTIPAFYILFSEWFTWLLDKQSTHSPLKKSIAITYSITILLFVNFLALPFIYNLLVLIPVTLHLSYNQNSSRKIYRGVTLSLLIITLLIYPLYSSVMHAFVINGQYQQQMIRLTASLITDDNATYLSGIPYLYDQDQTVVGLKNLIGPQLDYLSSAKEELEPLLLPSLYLSLINQQQVMYQLETQPIKVIINNYRMHGLPPKIEKYIQQHYLPYYGSLYLYAPVISGEAAHFNLRFTGKYKVQSDVVIAIDKKVITPDSEVELKKGTHKTQSGYHDYRLVLDESDKLAGLPAQPQDQWLLMLRAILS